MAGDLTVARSGRDQPLLVVQRPGLQPGVARHRHDLPGGVVDFVSFQLHAVGRANLPLPVIEGARQIHRQGAAAAVSDFALLVIEVVGAEGDRLRAQGAPGVVEHLIATDIQFAGVDLRAGGADIPGAAVEQNAFRLGLAAADIHALAAGAEITACQGLPVGAQLAAGANFQIPGVGELAVAFHPGGQHALLAPGEAGRVDPDVVRGSDHPAVVKLAGGLQVGCVARAQGAAVLDAPVGRKGHAARLGADGPGVTHPDAGLGADHADFACVHAAEAGHVHRQLRASGGIVAAFFDNFVGRIHLVAPGGDFQIVGPQPGVNLHRAGDNVGVIRAGGVHPGALDHHLAALDVKSGQRAVLHLWLAGGEGGAVGVDKAAAATGDARRVGDHYLGFFTGHLDHAVQLARVAGAHLVEDHFGFAFRQPRVARHHAAYIGLHVFVRVVEDRPFAVHVELGVVVT